ncbi:MAG: hypothetical protein IPH04_22610 [Saprospirales bacterium]|jgi:hypothetical protein|nr:hypothetical protein [Saprospirales bacterium]MBK6905513.1 hypothetical protein [Saprospirales bacterium]MBK7338073.1 hypothetical protein [Saprospirales bacterium]
MDKFFDPETSEKILQRLEFLQADTKPNWGIMKPAQMLKHLQLENDLALGKYSGKDHSNFFTEWAFKMVIKGRMPLPTLFSKMRMVPAIPELNIVKSNITVEDFETEKVNLKKSFSDLLNASQLSDLHPAIGKMNREEWMRFRFGA